MTLDTARVLAQRLVDGAIWWEDACTFFTAGVDPRGTGAICHGTCDGSLYEGTAGIARFLGHVGAHDGSEPFLRTARGCLAHARRHARGPGMYDGLAGVAAVMVELGERWNDRKLVDEGATLVRHVVESGLEDPKQGEWDLTAGTAGVVVALVGIASVTGDGGLLEHARELAGEWEKRGQARSEGFSWPSLTYPGEAPDRDDLCGLAHGGSGAALALGLLGRATGEERWAATAVEVRRYERAGYDPRTGGWLDLRTEAGEQLGQHFWCHGSAGVAAERLAALRAQPCDRALADAAAAIRGLESWTEAVLAGPQGPGRSFEANLSVCHGLAGAADVLITAAAALDEARLLDPARRVAGLTATHLAHGELPGGLQGADEVPGFMLGIAGTAHVLARLDAPVAFSPATLPPLADRV